MTRTLVAFSLGLALCVAGPATAADTKFSQAQIEEMVAPIALYPDDVLSQMLIAATYPLEIVEADRWRDKNPSLEGRRAGQGAGAVRLGSEREVAHRASPTSSTACRTIWSGRRTWATRSSSSATR